MRKFEIDLRVKPEDDNEIVNADYLVEPDNDKKNTTVIPVQRHGNL